MYNSVFLGWETSKGFSTCRAPDYRLHIEQVKTNKYSRQNLNMKFIFFYCLHLVTSLTAMAQQIVIEPLQAEAAPTKPVVFKQFRCPTSKTISTIPGARASSGINYAFTTSAKYTFTITRTDKNGRTSRDPPSTSTYPKSFYNRPPVLTELPTACSAVLSEYPIRPYAMLYTGGTPGPFRAIYATATVTKKEGTAMKTVPTPTSLVFAGWLSILKKRLVPTLRDAALLPDYSKVVERDL